MKTPKKLATDLKQLIRSRANEEVRMGMFLSSAKDLLVRAGHGHRFSEWVELECKLSIRNARRYMKLYEAFGPRD